MQERYIEIPNYDDSVCFACGPKNEKGLQMKFYATEEKVYCDLVLPEHMAGWNGVSHGGIVSTLLDETMSWGAIFLLKKLVLTKNMTVTYHKPVPVGENLRVESRIKERISDKEGVMQAEVYKGDRELCASSTGTFFLMDRERINKLGFVDENEVDFYWNLINTTTL